MQVVLGIISFALLGVIIYFMVSPKSSHLLKMSAMGALALIGLAVAVCGVFLLRGPAKVETEIYLPFLTDAEPKQQNKTNTGVIAGYFAAVAIIIGLLAYYSKREKERKNKSEKKAVRAQNFQAADESALDINEELNDDESFDIGID